MTPSSSPPDDEYDGVRRHCWFWDNGVPSHPSKVIEMQSPRISQDQIDIRVFKDIHICFPGDVYILAVWLVLKDRSRTTAIRRSRTMLSGLANHLARLQASDGTVSLSRDAVMDIFKQHGITGNPALMLGEGEEENELPHLIKGDWSTLAGFAATTAEQSCDSEPLIKQISGA